MQSKPQKCSPPSSSLLTLATSFGNSVVKGVHSTFLHSYDYLQSTSYDKERVEFLKFGHLEYRHASDSGRQEGVYSRRLILVVGYKTGFQVWDLQDSSNVRELVSKRDGPIR